VRIDETFDIAAPQETVFNRMNNVGDVGYCIAGVKRVEVINDRESNWKIEQRFGFMARTFDLKAQIKELDPPKRIAFGAAGQDVEVDGHISFTAVEPALTRCELEIEVEVVGALAPLVEVFAKGPQQALVRETVANLRAALEGEGPPPAPATESAPKRGLIARIRAWFGPKHSDNPA
jgi:carbon monoxide dehydrogenase subunit G